MTAPYYTDDSVTLYLGDCRELLPDMAAAGMRFDCAVTDPPYGETSLTWDRWPDGWPALVAALTSSMWCFGSLRMFLDRRDEFKRWRLSHDGIMRKQVGTSFQADRFVKVHEQFAHWYTGRWDAVYHQPQRVTVGIQRRGKQKQGRHDDHLGRVGYDGVWEDDGTRLMQSVIEVPNMRARGTHPTEKPVGILDPLIRYACPEGGTVLDLFAGSGSTAEAARMSGRCAVLIEADERYCEAIARRLAADVLPIGGAS